MKPWKVIIVLVGIFAAGIVTGGFVVARGIRERVVNRPMPDQWAPKHLKRLADRLELTAEQQEEIRPIVRRNMESLGRLRNYTATETRSIFEGMEREVAEKLTPAQKLEFEKMNREFRAKAERAERDRERKDRPPGDKPPGDKPPGDAPAEVKPAGK